MNDYSLKRFINPSILLTLRVMFEEGILISRGIFKYFILRGTEGSPIKIKRGKGSYEGEALILKWNLYKN